MIFNAVGHVFFVGQLQTHNDKSF